MREAVIVAGARTAVGRAPRGILRNYRPDDLAADLLKGLMKRVPQVKPEEIDDVVLGCAFPELEQGMNLARIVSMRAGLPNSVSAFTINRFCSSGLQAIALAVQNLMCGWAEVVVAGGVESMSMIPMGGSKICPNPDLMESYPQAYLSMGLTAEVVAERYRISREDQDAFALASHQKAVKAIQEGKFREEIVPVTVGNKEFDVDEGPRPDTTLEGLAGLRPVFKVGGSVTPGNSSQMSDGAAAVLVMTAEKARQYGLRPLAVMRSFAVGGVDPEVMGIGPVVAIPKALKLAGLSLDQIELIELNEAFAAQSLAVVRELGLDPHRVNVNGGAIALGHPLGCTGAKLTVQLLNEMQRRQARYGMVSMCIGGGMGAAGIFERIS